MRRGFTLVEALVALLVFSLVATVAIRGIASVLGTTSRLRQQERAAQLAEDFLDRLIASQAWHSSAGSGDFDPVDYGAGAAGYGWQLTSESRHNGAVQCLTLRVSWAEEREALQFATLVPADGFGSGP